MSEKDTGGPAFPDPGRAQSVKQREILGNQGMSLRDWFAGMAMQAMMTQTEPSLRMASRNAIAIVAYEVANTMIQERSK